MSQIAPEVWLGVTTCLPRGEALTARQAIPSVSPRLLAAIDADSRRHLLVPLEDGEKEFKDTSSRGLHVVTREMTLRGRHVTRYIDLICADPAGHATFDLIAGDICDQLVIQSDEPAEIVRKVLVRWRRFWGQVPNSVLTREEVIGLFSETWFISQWMSQRASPIDTMLRWRGPFGARHDFEWVGNSVEVKGTTSPSGRVHRIHGLEQLAPPESGQLLFFSLQLREEAGATHTLPGLIEACRKCVTKDLAALDVFETALVRSGYLESHSDEYNKLRFRITSQKLFRVEDDFPRLTPASFAVPITSGIERIEYDVNLSGYSHLIVADSPESAASF